MQAAGGPEESFKYGGWSTPYYDDALDTIAEKQKQAAKNLHLGRKSFEIFIPFFPDHDPQLKTYRKFDQCKGISYVQVFYR